MYAVIDSTTGEALSFGTVVADPLPEGTEAIAIDHQPGAGEGWDAATRAVVATDPPPDPGVFFGAMIQLFGHKRATTLDRDYGAVWRGIETRTDNGYSLALSAIEEMLASGDLNQAEYDQAQGAWDAAHLPRP